MGGLRVGRLAPLGWVAHKWLFCLCGMRGKICWRLVGAVPMCPPASPCKGAPIVQTPTHNAYIFGWKRRCVDVRAGTQAPPLRFRLGDCAQTVGVVWADCTWPVDAVLGIARGRLISFEQITFGRVMPFGWIACGRLTLFLRYSARMPLRILFLCFLFL